MNDTRLASVLETLEPLWVAHRRRAFPCSGKEIQGIDLILLDYSAAGCIHTFLYAAEPTPYRLDEQSILMLDDCARQLALIQPDLTAENERDYFARLDEMVKLILDWIHAQA